MVRADAAGSVLRAKSPLRGGSRHAAVTLRQECLGVSDTPDPPICTGNSPFGPVRWRRA
jgi:hypothetical protein